MKADPLIHLIDTLDIGGAETMCVELANLFASHGWPVHLCATRRGGALEERISPSVRLLRLGRKATLDAGAVLRLKKYIEAEGIRLVHAHGTSVFLAALIRILVPMVRVVWHDHYGRQEEEERPWFLYRCLLPWVSGVAAVNTWLAAWAVDRVGFRPDRVWVVPNFPAVKSASQTAALPGVAGYRIVHLANVRPQKDHATMLRALARIREEEPRAHLILAGECGEDGYGGTIRQLASELGVDRAVSFLGVWQDVGGLLRGCDVGVLSSASEGLPVALLEYGEAGLAVVCTDVGDCRRVLDGCGILVPPRDAEALARGVLELLHDPGRRRELGERLRARVRALWSAEAALQQFKEIYETVME